MLRCQREKFLLQRKTAYINCAYMSPIPKKVEKAGIRGIKAKRKPHLLPQESFFKDSSTARKLFADLINCNEPNRVVIMPSVSYGIATIIKNLKRKKGNVVLTARQFPSNVYGWKTLEKEGVTLRLIERPMSEQAGEDWNEEILNAITDDTIAVTIGNVHWADGTIFDLEAIRRKTLSHGSLLIIDGTQSIGALPFDLQSVKADAVITAAYKWMMGPYGLTFGYFGAYFDHGIPLEDNWINRKGSEDFSSLIEYSDEYREGSLRYEMGERSNFALLPMGIEGIKLVRHWQPSEVQSYCDQLLKAHADEIKELGFDFDTGKYQSKHLLGIQCPDHLDVMNLKKSLKRNRVSISIRGTKLRVSPNVYNDDRDIRKLLKSLRESFGN